MCVSARAAYPADATSVAAARHWAVRILADAYGPHEGVLDDAALVVSELATNCVEAGPGPFSIALDCHHTSLVVRATDAADGTPAPRPHDPRAAHGRGLILVSSIAREWGVEPERAGKTVWAELTVDLQPAPAFRCRLAG